jgi:cytoskeleton protein RodZ
MRLKVPVSKIEGLENNQWDLFADLVFARTLAISTCKQLRIDPAPVLALLPKAAPPRLNVEETGLNQRFLNATIKRDRPWWLVFKTPLGLAVPLLVIAALMLYFWGTWFPSHPAPEEPAMPPDSPLQIEAPKEAGASSPTSSTSSTEDAPQGPPAKTPALAAPRASPPPSPSPLLATANSAAVGFTATATSWVQVSDATGKVVFSKTLQAGESADAQGQAPLKVVLGNAGGTHVLVKNQTFDTQPFVVNNVARFEVQP